MVSGCPLGQVRENAESPVTASKAQQSADGGQDPDLGPFKRVTPPKRALTPVPKGEGPPWKRDPPSAGWKNRYPPPVPVSGPPGGTPP